MAHRSSPDPRRSLRATASATDSVTPLARLAARGPCTFEDPQGAPPSGKLLNNAAPLRFTPHARLASASYTDQLVKGLRTHFRRVVATRARMPWLRFIMRNWFLADPLNPYKTS